MADKDFVVKNGLVTGTNNVTIGNSVYIVANGNVGIGTATPNSILTVFTTNSNQNFNAITGVYSSNQGPSSNGTGGAGVAGYNLNGYGVLGATSNGSGVIGVTNTGFGVAGITRLANSIAGYFGNESSGLGVKAVSNTGIPFVAANNTVDFMSILANGSVGIGTATPSSKLQVVGSCDATSLIVGVSTIANSTGVYTGIVNAATHSVGSNTIANSSGVYTGVVNAASHTVGTSTIANSTGVYTGIVNAATHSVGSNTIANSSGVYTGVVNAASHTVGTAFTANATVVNAVSYNSGSTLIANSTGPYGKTEGNLNVNSAATLATSRNINGSAFNGSAAITTATWGTARTITIGATSRTVDGSGNYSWSLAEIDTPSRTGSGASGTWGISITGNAGTANGLETTQSSLGYSASAQNIDFNSQGGPQVRNQGSGAAMMSFHRPGAYGINFGLGNDNQLRTGGWSRGGNFVVLDSGNYNSYAPTLTGGNASGNWNIKSTNYTDYGGANQDIRTSASPTFNTIYATVFRNSADNNTRLENGGLILRGSSPTIFLRDTDQNSGFIHCNASTFYVLRGSNDSEAWSQVGGQWPFYINLTNNDANFGAAISAVGNITAYASDKRLKENIKEIPDAIEKIKKIRGVTFDWNDLSEQQGFTPDRKYDDVGVIAQEIQEVLPNVVTLAPFDIWSPDPGVNYSDKELTEKSGTSKSGNNYLTVQYEKIVPLLIQAIKELSNEIEELKK